MPPRLLTSREVAALTGLTIHRIRQLAPVYAEKRKVFASACMWLWDDDALAKLAARRKAPGSGRRKETK